jgi:hypothetical protein
VERGEETLGPPVFEPEERAETDFVDARFADAIGGIEAVKEVGLTPLRVM